MGYFLSLSRISKSAAETGLNVSEILLLVCGFVLAWGCIGEYLEEHERLDKLPRWLQWPSLVFILMVAFSLVGEFLGDAGVYLFSYHLQSIEEAELTRLGADADRLEKRLRLVDESSQAAGKAAGIALANSGKAASLSMSALSAAKGARKEADSLEKDIAAAKLRLLDLTPRDVLVRNNEREILEEIGPFGGQNIGQRGALLSSARSPRSPCFLRSGLD
jgi:hypothetical protein